jgi:histidyl-tRNA synthetase
VIQLYHMLLTRLGVSEFTLALNSIGCRECRPAYLEELRAWLEANSHRLDAATQEKAAVSPLRVFDNFEAKPAAVQEALSAAPKIGESLCGVCREHFAAVRRDLDAYGIAYDLVPTLVRGLDYYTRTTWEFYGADEGAQASSLSGGGRYDGLVEEIGGPPTPGVGFGAGIERLLLALEHAGVEAVPPAVDVFFALETDASRELVAGWLQEQRLRGVAADTDYAHRSLKGQLTQAGRLGAGTIVIVRSDGATLRRPGQLDEDVALDEVSARLAA